MRKERHQDISPLVWLIFPIVSYIFLYGVMLTGFPPSVAQLLGSEQGVIENAQVLFLLLFIGFGSRILWRKTPLPHPRLRLWLLLLIAGGLYTLMAEWLNRPLPARHGELQEYFMYGFLFIYLYSLHYRLGASQREYSPTPA